jgi:hypothetical protein
MDVFWAFLVALGMGAMLTPALGLRRAASEERELEHAMGRSQ